MMNKGIVMEVLPESIIVMKRDGGFERIPARNRKCQVGEEIMYAPPAVRFRQPAFAAAALFAAVVIMGLMLFSAVPSVWADKSIVAYVSIDINPSVELGIDKQEKVRELRGLNDDGRALVQDLKYKGKPLDDFAYSLLSQAEKQKYFDKGEGSIIIASTLVQDQTKLDDQSISEHLKQQVMVHVLETHPDEVDKFEVAAFAAPEETRKAAEDNGLSVGKYSVYLAAKSEGHDIAIDDLKKESVQDLAKPEGGLSKLVTPSKLSKDSLKELLQAEKDGTLDTSSKKAASPSPSTKPGKNGKSTLAPGKSGSTPRPSATPVGTSKPVVKPVSTEKNTPPGKNGKGEEDKGKDDQKKDDKSKDDKNKDNKNKEEKSTPAQTPDKEDKGKGKGSEDKGKDKKKDSEGGNNALETPPNGGKLHGED